MQPTQPVRQDVTTRLVFDLADLVGHVAADTLEFVQRRGEGIEATNSWMLLKLSAIGPLWLGRAPAQTSYVSRPRMIASAVASCSATRSPAHRRCSRSATPL